jgi:glycosyltransferase involved in cell wall biosynthesis
VEVSVVIAVHNGEDSILRTLDSLAVALPDDSEIIVVDDGSTDATAARVEARDDSRVRLLRQTNQGPAVAANTGLAVARGRFVARLDCGDLCHPQRLRLQREFLLANPGTLMIGCGVRRLDAHGRVLGCSPVVRGAARIRRGLMRMNLFQHSAVMIRREALEAVGGYRPFFRFSLDLDLFLRLSERGPLDNLPETLSDWVLEPASISFRYRGVQARLAQLARQSAAARRSGRPDPVEGELWKPPVLVLEPPTVQLGHYHLEVARSLLMGEQPTEARKELRLARGHGLPISSLLFLHAYIVLPAWLRRLARRARVAWMTR